MNANKVRTPYVLEAEGQAVDLREELGLGSDAIGDLFELLIDLDLKLLRWPMGEDGPDGFYVRKGELALVAINSSKRVTRQRFTAAHELGHHLFDQRSRVDRDIFANPDVVEGRANAFAAFFLMPREGARRWLARDRHRQPARRDIKVETVVHLARHFGMSYEATLYQLRDLGLLNLSDVDALKIAAPERVARRLGYDLDADGLERDRRVLPPDYVQRALHAYGAGDISLLRLAELLRTDLTTAEKLAKDAGVEPATPSMDDLFDEARHA